MTDSRVFASASLSLPDGGSRPATGRQQPVLCWELGEAPTVVNRLSPSYLAAHKPVALLALVPRAAVLFGAGALSGAIAKSITAPLDRVRLLMLCCDAASMPASHGCP